MSKRIKRPDPRYKDGDFDDTNYIDTRGGIFPGICVEGSNSQFSAGVFVQKGDDIRLTVACHTWREYAQQKVQDPTPVVALSHCGETIGEVSLRIGKTDIGLASLKPELKMSNRLLDIATTAKKLLPSHLVSMYDQFLFDSFVTGRQRIICLGHRVVTSNSSEFLNKQPEPGQYISLKQNVFSTDEPEITGFPKVREGVCGSAIIRCRTSGQTSDIQLLEGEVAGFMHWSDLQLKEDKLKVSRSLICLADAVDEFLEDGWEAADFTKTELKRKLEERGERSEETDDGAEAEGQGHEVGKVGGRSEGVDVGGREQNLLGPSPKKKRVD